MSGPLVTVVDSGGIPVTPVESGAPLLTAGEGGFAITIVESGGAPFIVEGLGYSPAALFENGEAGFWADVSPSTVWQDAARTTPTDVGDPVGSWLLNTGAGPIYATQATAGSRPTLQQDSGGRYYLLFDGVDDGLVTAAINFSAGDEMSVFAGIRKGVDTPIGAVVVLGGGSAAAGSFVLFAPASGTNITYRTTGSAAQSNAVYNVAAPATVVIAAQSKFGTSFNQLRVDGSVRAEPATVSGARNYLSAALYIGRRNVSDPFNGRLYGLVVRGALTPDPVPVEQYLAGKTGLSF